MWNHDIPDSNASRHDCSPFPTELLDVLIRIGVLWLFDLIIVFSCYAGRLDCWVQQARRSTARRAVCSLSSRIHPQAPTTPKFGRRSRFLACLVVRRQRSSASYWRRHVALEDVVPKADGETSRRHHCSSPSTAPRARSSCTSMGLHLDRCRTPPGAAASSTNHQQRLGRSCSGSSR